MGLIKLLSIIFVIYIVIKLLKVFFKLIFIIGKKTGEIKREQVKNPLNEEKTGRNGKKIIELDKDQYKVEE